MYSDGERVAIVGGSYFNSKKPPIFATVTEDYWYSQERPNTKVSIRFDSPQRSSSVRFRRTVLETKLGLQSVTKLIEDPEDSIPSPDSPGNESSTNAPVSFARAISQMHE